MNLNKKLWINERRRISKRELKLLYLSLLPRVRRIARRLGYAIGLHGSCTRDLDLIAAPWTSRAVSALTLAVRNHKAIAKYSLTRNSFVKQGYGGKPHGRKAFVLYFGCHAEGTKKPAAIYIDLSIMPRL